MPLLLAFAIGSLTLRWLPLPHALPLALLAFAVFILILLPWRVLHGLAALLLGVLLAWLAIGQWQADLLLPELDGETRWLQGRVAGLPEQEAGVWRFELVELTAERAQLPARLRLSWTGGSELHAGEQWRLAVKLQRPHGLVNPAGFDREAWLAARHIGATGTVKTGQKLAGGQGLDAWRDALRQRLQQEYSGPAAGVLAALVLGDGSGLDDQQWQLLQQTGTVHLLVISGQHVVLVAGMLFALVALLFRLGLWPLRWPWLPAATLLALAGALLYSLLAGMGVPVQRACLMLAVLLLWRWRYRQSGVWLPLLLALDGVLLADPLVSLQPGFWLSFVAVALLIWCLAGRLGPDRWWREMLWVQWAMTLGLLPVLLALGLPVSPGGLLANLLAVPWVGLLIVPPALAGFLLLAVPGVGSALLWLAGWQLDWLFRLLELLAGWLPLLHWPAPGPLALAGAVLAVLLLLAPAGLALRLPALLLLLALLWPRPLPVAHGQAEVLVLDVGQGLAVQVRTAGHVLLYDAGPATPGFDTGSRVILPALLGQGIDQLDLLLLSHADRDHAGGANALLAALPVTRLLAGELGRQQLNRPADSCRDGDSWQWDGVQFRLLQWAQAASSNDASCVLLVEAAGERILLTGDISVTAEAHLLQSGRDLAADWLLAAHHGSHSSSSLEFIRQVQPQAVLISRGRRNSYGHPHPQVIARYQSEGVLIYDTARDGALRLQLGQRQPVVPLRELRGGFWRER